MKRNGYITPQERRCREERKRRKKKHPNMPLRKRVIYDPYSITELKRHLRLL